MSRNQLNNRNSKIVRKFAKGSSLNQLAIDFELSRIRVYKIVRAAGFDPKGTK